MHLMEAIPEAELRFLLASLKGENFHVSGKGHNWIQLKLPKIDLTGFCESSQSNTNTN